MNPAIAQSIVVASAGMASVGSILIVLLLLGAENGISKANGYVGGYVLTYAAVGLTVVAVSPARLLTLTNGFAPVAPLIKLILGAAFAALAVRCALTRGGDVFGPSLTLLGSDRVSTFHTFAIGMLAPIVNVKNLVIFVYAAYLVSMSNSNGFESSYYILLITALFCSTVILPIIAVGMAPEYVGRSLASLRNILERRGHAVSIFALGGVGALFLVQGSLALARLS